MTIEIRRISALVGRMPWPKDKLDAVVRTVSPLEGEARVDSFIQLCVRG